MLDYPNNKIRSWRLIPSKLAICWDIAKCCVRKCGTYGTEPVTVSLKATLGFPITHGQLYSLSILYNTNQNLFIDQSLSPEQGNSYLFLHSQQSMSDPIWFVSIYSHDHSDSGRCSYTKQCGSMIFGWLISWRFGFVLINIFYMRAVSLKQGSEHRSVWASATKT